MIGGNVTAEVQTKTITVNPIGEQEEKWSTLKIIRGYLDLISGDSKYETYNAKIQESTHVFICDYTPLGVSVNARLIVDGKNYDVMFIDNPMNLNRQLEIYLKMVGG